ncbi:aromatase [Amycolatopsis xylanica]|uniref:Aromatase n=1 Tax=Amycolatopsis xylanica TaxID=589385 RepID=A0A1H3RWW3_9PSEU|nr:aromatase/cyclase [Amycolatopsis xylanica]SDZ29349.1 aromatase [Amycolatopsis xylanica]
MNVEHEITVAAPAVDIYAFLADVTRWPTVFEPTVHASVLERSGNVERIRLWATANGSPRTWTSRRVLDPAGLRVEFRQEVPRAPIASMGGAWVIEPLSAGSSRVRLLHDYEAIDQSGIAWIDQAVDRNSHKELAALKTFAEGTVAPVHTFADTVHIKGSAADVYAFINEADRWPERLPHVDRVALTEDIPGLQLLEMDTRAPNGSVHTTSSVRVTFPKLIVYKQTLLPALLSLHTGQWQIREVDDGVQVTSEHSVSVHDPATLDQVRAALSANSLATLRHAKAYAESQEEVLA